MRISGGPFFGAVAVVTLLTGSSLSFGSPPGSPPASPPGSASARPPDAVPFPADYRTWAHVKSTLVGPQSAFAASQLGIHHIYANAQAVEGYRTGKFPDGSILVYDLLETIEANGNTNEGRQRRVDLMVKQSETYRDTGGWGFARYDPAEGRAGELRPTCFGCHSRQGQHDFVFSEFRTVTGPPSATVPGTAESHQPTPSSAKSTEPN